ncbi:UNVERIFIED_CONTAM: hypothetical protein GTU68_013495 [Idotea baltica]|nr:hypothetical protein [Idotea baltica]
MFCRLNCIDWFPNCTHRRCCEPFWLHNRVKRYRYRNFNSCPWN